MTLTKSRAVAWLLFALPATVFAASPAQAQQKLRWKLKKGQTLNYVMTQKMNMSSMAGLNIKMTNTMDMTWKVENVKSDGTAKIAQRITRVRIVMEGGPLGKQEYDSDKKDNAGLLAGQFKKTFGALVNVDITMMMSPRGEVKSLDLSDEAKAALKKAAAGGGPGGGGISADTFKQMSSQMGAFFPEKAVSKGTTWKNTFEMDNPAGKMKVDTTFKYAGTVSEGGRRLAKIELKPVISMTPKAGAPVAITFKDKGSSGASYFDVSKGVLTRSSVVQNLEIGAAGMTMTIKGTTEMKLKK